MDDASLAPSADRPRPHLPLRLHLVDDLKDAVEERLLHVLGQLSLALVLDVARRLVGTQAPVVVSRPAEEPERDNLVLVAQIANVVGPGAASPPPPAARARPRGHRTGCRGPTRSGRTRRRAAMHTPPPKRAAGTPPCSLASPPRSAGSTKTRLRTSARRAASPLPQPPGDVEAAKRPSPHPRRLPAGGRGPSARLLIRGSQVRILPGACACSCGNRCNPAGFGLQEAFSARPP